MSRRKLLVLGGNGFVGQAVCAEGVHSGWQVASLSRSGPPRLLPPALQSVTWHRGSASDPISYASNRDILKDVDYVVHSIGLLFADGLRTPQALSVDTCRAVLDAVSASGQRFAGFGYVSAAQFASPLKRLMHSYYAGKEDVEQLLADQAPLFERVVIARPGLLYGDLRWSTKPVAFFYNVGTWFTGGVFPRALSVHLLARCLLTAMDDPSAHGVRVLDVPDMLRQSA
jgi:nucleoside-diphosphate-sugar epimerase